MQPSGMPRKILCPVDLSELSRAALRYAAGLAACWNAETTALHAYCFELPAYFTDQQIENFEAEQGDVRSGAERALRDFVRTVLGESAQHIRTIVVRGSATEAIASASASTHADLIVMGTHGRTGFRRLLLGSIAEHALHTSRIPVLMVRSGLGVLNTSLVIRNIVCPVNDTVAARQSLSLAASIAGCHGATLTLLHVKEASPEHPISDLCSWVPALERSLCHIQPVTREGRVAEEVFRLATEVKADLLAVGAWHRPLLDRTVIGCTTAHLVRHADCPVLVVPAASHETAQDGKRIFPRSNEENFDYESYGAE